MSSTDTKPTVILTHPHGEDDFLLNSFKDKDFEVISDPMIATEELTLTEAQKEEIYNSRKIIFTSKRGVKYFLNQVPLAEMLNKSFLCVGRKTAITLERRGLKPWWVSNGRTSTDLVEDIREYTIRSEEKWTAILGDLADDTIVNGLSDMCQVARYNAYKTIIAKEGIEATKQALKKGDRLWVIITSPSCFSGFMDVYGDLIHNNVKFTSIGPVTTKAMEDRNVTPSVIAPISTYEGIIYAITNQL